MTEKQERTIPVEVEVYGRKREVFDIPDNAYLTDEFCVATVKLGRHDKLTNVIVKSEDLIIN